jgi:hypothetical protein
MPHFTIHEWKAVRQKRIEGSNVMHTYCGDSPFKAVLGCQSCVDVPLTEYRGVHCAAEIRNKIKETSSIHEMWNTTPIPDNTVHWMKKSTNDNYSNGKYSTFQTIFRYTTAAKDENCDDNSNEYNLAFYHICLRSCAINRSILIKGTGSSVTTRIIPALRHRFLLSHFGG